MGPIKFDGASVGFWCEPTRILPAEQIGKPETGQIYVSLLTFGQPLQPVLVSVDKPAAYNPE